MSRIPLELKVTPVSRGFYASLVVYAAALALLGRDLSTDTTVQIILCVTVVGAIWSVLDSLKAKKWALVGLVLWIALPFVARGSSGRINANDANAVPPRLPSG